MNFSQLEFALDSIIDAIESNSLKSAESLCEKALKKWPSSTQVIALKALILWYNSKIEASNALVQQVISKNPTDYMTLSVLERILESRNEYGVMVGLFENALKSSFDDRVAERLFSCYLKLGMTKKLFPIASKLYSSTKNGIFSYWSVLGLLLHSDAADSEQERRIQLELAKRTLQKIGFPIGTPQLASTHKQLLMIVFEKTGDYQGLLETAQIHTAYDPSDDKKVIIDCLIKLGDATKALEASEAMIKNSPSLDFDLWKMICSIPESKEYIKTRLMPVLEALQSSDDRGVKLAKIYFDLRFKVSEEAEFSENLLHYAIEMSSKGSMTFDVIQILSELNSQTINCFANALQAKLDSFNSSDQILKHSALLFIARYLNHYHPSILKISDMVESFIKEAALPARILETSKDVPSSAVNIALYASLTDIDDYLASLELSHLKNCYQRLTFFSSSFPESYSFLLIRFIVAANLGIFLPEIIEQLEIKCLQLDTLGYLITELAPVFLDFSAIKSFFKEAQSLYESNNRETWNLISQSLDNGAIVSVLDFYEFSNRLERSLQSAAFDAANLNSLLMIQSRSSLIQDSSVQAIVERLQKALSLNLLDNRDFKVFNSIDACGNLLKLVKNFAVFETNNVSSLVCHFDSSINYSNHDSFAARLSELVTDPSSTELILEAFNKELFGDCKAIAEKPFSFKTVLFIGGNLQNIKRIQFALEANSLPSASIRNSYRSLIDLIRTLSSDNLNYGLLEEQKIALKRFEEYINLNI